MNQAGDPVMSPNIVRVLGVVTLLPLAVACGTTPREPDPTKGPTPDSAVASSSSSQNLADRRQGSYQSTLLRAGNGAEFSRGHALLEIVHSRRGAQISLTLEASDEAQEEVRAKLELSQLTPATVGRKLETGALRQAAVQRLQSDEPIQQDRVVSLELRHVSSTGVRPVIEGSITTGSSSTSLQFRTEYQVECLVPPELIGAASNGTPGPAETVARPLVADEAFQSDCCAQYAFLR
jgi:hypothetical protein